MTKETAGTGSSVVVNSCQICGGSDLESVLFIGYIPPVNQMRDQGERPREQPAYPAEMLSCPTCTLVQLGCIVDPEVLFPPEYPYTSGTTGILHRNFEEMVRDCKESVLEPGSDDLVVDIGSNDGTLLSKWQTAGFRVHGIEPTDKAQLANENGVPSTQAFFNRESATGVAEKHGQARVVTATNVFAHIENIHDIVESLLCLLADDGVFISESHYLPSLVETCQYDTIYHEHLRYYSLHSLKYLFDRHDLEIIHAKKIPTHGGSVRVYAARRGKFEVQDSVKQLMAAEVEQGVEGTDWLREFAKQVARSKLQLYRMLADIKEKGGRVYGIAAPSRASTLITYTGLDEQTLDCVLEIKGSHKIGKYMPGTLIPVDEESRLFDEQPEYAMFLAWHIADELIPILRKKGFKGGFIVPLPEPRVIE